MSSYQNKVYTGGVSAALPDTGADCNLQGLNDSRRYADDMILLTPAVEALQDLIRGYEIYTVRHDIIYTMIRSARPEVNNLTTAASLRGCAPTFVNKVIH